MVVNIFSLVHVQTICESLHIIFVPIIMVQPLFLHSFVLFSVSVDSIPKQKQLKTIPKVSFIAICINVKLVNQDSSVSATSFVNQEW